mgnify:CR=1 FL=1
MLMNRGHEFEQPEQTDPNPIPIPQGRGRERFSLKSESGVSDLDAVFISMGIGFAILFGVILYPVVSDRVFGKRVENYCILSTIMTSAQCYTNVTPLEGEK